MSHWIFVFSISLGSSSMVLYLDSMFQYFRIISGLFTTVNLNPTNSIIYICITYVTLYSRLNNFLICEQSVIQVDSIPIRYFETFPYPIYLLVPCPSINFSLYWFPCIYGRWKNDISLRPLIILSNCHNPPYISFCMSSSDLSVISGCNNTDTFAISNQSVLSKILYWDLDILIPDRLG